MSKQLNLQAQTNVLEIGNVVDPKFVDFKLDCGLHISTHFRQFLKGLFKLAHDLRVL